MSENLGLPLEAWSKKLASVFLATIKPIPKPWKVSLHSRHYSAVLACVITVIALSVENTTSPPCRPAVPQLGQEGREGRGPREGGWLRCVPLSCGWHKTITASPINYKDHPLHHNLVRSPNLLLPATRGAAGNTTKDVAVLFCFFCIERKIPQWGGIVVPPPSGWGTNRSDVIVERSCLCDVLLYVRPATGGFEYLWGRTRKVYGV